MNEFETTAGNYNALSSCRPVLSGRLEAQESTERSRVARIRCRTAERGQALVPVVFVTLILTLVAVAFSVSAHRSARAASNYVAQMQRFYAAYGAVNYAMAALAQTSNNGATYGNVPPLPDTDANGWGQLGDAWVKIETIDTGAFINLNSVTATTLGTMPIFQDNPDLAAAVIQWRTPTSSTTGTTGTTASTSSSSSSSSTASGTDPYQSLPVPYAIKGANFDTPEELLLVQGMSPTILYGSPAGTPINPDDAESSPVTIDSNSVTGASSSSSGTGTAKEDFTDVYTNSKIPLVELFTTVSRERNVATDGTPRINVVTATSQQLQDGLGITAAQATSFISFRTPRPANQVIIQGPATPTTGKTNTRGADEDESRQAAGTGAAKPATGTSTAKPATGTGAGGAAASTITNIADLLQSSVFTRTVMQKVADRVSVNGSVYRTNVVNINTAPPEVLATVPGMTHNIISAIQTYRQGGQSFQDLGDFFALTTLQRSDFIAVVGSLATKSSTYIVHVKVRTSDQQSVYAVSALVEMTDSGPHILQWREVGRTPGWSTWIKPPVLPAPTPGQNSSGSTGTAAGS